MSNVKRFLVLLMSLVMVLGMTLTVSAEGDTTPPGATIIIEGADGAELAYAQVIKADPTKETGWTIVSGYESLFAGFLPAGKTGEQEMIKGWIAASDENGGNENSRLENLGSVGTTTVITGTSITNAQAGLYVIKAQDSENATIKHTYSTVLVYVSLADAKEGKEVKAVIKKTPYKVDKTYGEGDKYVAIGDQVGYTIKATVPYKPAGGSAELVVTDKLTGGEFVESTIEVKIGEDIITPDSITISDDKTEMEIVLTEVLINDVTVANENANKEVVITYKAVVTGTAIENEATVNNNPETTKVKSYTGTLQITKIDATTEEKLDGAEFVIVNGSKYAILETVDGVKQLADWTTNIDDATKLLTNDEGVDSARGFDKDVIYSFHEVTAPDGYSLNTTDEDVTWSGEDDALLGTATMGNTTLSTLPYTGGKGTAAFTGFGVLLMSVAAGLYYANKKNKSVK